MRVALQKGSRTDRSSPTPVPPELPQAPHAWKAAPWRPGRGTPGASSNTVSCGAPVQHTATMLATQTGGKRAAHNDTRNRLSSMSLLSGKQQQGEAMASNLTQRHTNAT